MKYQYGILLIIAILMLILVIASGCAYHPKLSTEYNGSVGDRARVRHMKVSPNNHHIKKKYAPVRAFKPNVK